MEIKKLSLVQLSKVVVAQREKKAKKNSSFKSHPCECRSDHHMGEWEC